MPWIAYLGILFVFKTYRQLWKKISGIISVFVFYFRYWASRPVFHHLSLQEEIIFLFQSSFYLINYVSTLLLSSLWALIRSTDTNNRQFEISIYFSNFFLLFLEKKVISNFYRSPLLRTRGLPTCSIYSYIKIILHILGFSLEGISPIVYWYHQRLLWKRDQKRLSFTLVLNFFLALEAIREREKTVILQTSWK